MKIEFTQVNGVTLALIRSGEAFIHGAQDALDLMVDCQYQGSDGMILRKENLIPGFFDLKTGIAGEILQKFSTYRVRLAIVGNFAIDSSQSLRDFIVESNKLGQVCFVETEEEAIRRLSKPYAA